MSIRAGSIVQLGLLLLLSIFQGCSQDGKTDPTINSKAAPAQEPLDDKLSAENKAKENAREEPNSTQGLGEKLEKANQKAEQTLHSAKTKIWGGVKNAIEPLTEADVKRYIQAYKNFAKMSPQLEAERKKSGSFIIFTCDECRGLLNQAAQDAGYPSFTSFLIMDARIHYTMRGVAYLRLADVTGKSVEALSAEVVRQNLKKNNELAPAEKVQANKLLAVVASLDFHISQLSSFATSMSKQLLQQGDLDLVAKHFDEIVSALTNPDLPVGLRHTTGGGNWDD